MISNREKAILNLSALLKLMKKGTPEQLSTMNLVQILEGRLEHIREMDVTFGNDNFEVLLPIATDGGRYDMIVNVSLRRTW